MDKSTGTAKPFTFFNFDDDDELSFTDDDDDDDDESYKTEQTLRRVRKNSDVRVFQHLLTLAPGLVGNFREVYYNNHHGQGSTFLQESMSYLSPQIFAYLLQHAKISPKSLHKFFHTLNRFHEPTLFVKNKSNYQLGEDLKKDEKLFLQEETYFFKLFLLLGNFIPNSGDSGGSEKVVGSTGPRFDKLREIYAHYLDFVTITTSVLPTISLGSLMIQYFV